MTREMGYFPYLDDVVSNPRTDGTIASIPTGREIEIEGPQQDIMTAPVNRGAVRDGGIGNTDIVDANTTHHTVFTGSF